MRNARIATAATMTAVLGFACKLLHDGSTNAMFDFRSAMAETKWLCIGIRQFKAILKRCTFADAVPAGAFIPGRICGRAILGQLCHRRGYVAATAGTSGGNAILSTWLAGHASQWTHQQIGGQQNCEKESEHMVTLRSRGLSGKTIADNANNPPPGGCRRLRRREGNIPLTHFQLRANQQVLTSPSRDAGDVFDDARLR